jgi:hypothetical protein
VGAQGRAVGLTERLPVFAFMRPAVYAGGAQASGVRRQSLKLVMMRKKERQESDGENESR